MSFLIKYVVTQYMFYRASMQGQFIFSKGTVLTLLVGQQPITPTASYPGGGSYLSRKFIQNIYFLSHTQVCIV